MTKITVSFFITSFLLIISILDNNFTYSKPLQILEHKPGYIAVYIRHGDEPLININPSLAEAFHEENILKGVVPVDKYDSPSQKNTVDDSNKPQNSLNSVNKKDVTAQPYMVSQTS
ncbi:uncharacterized protein [Chelonus insularis]|uniref:uncharacterized protein n=1 Tax=Chelonus insularis TaxID=460826 RepID=UPI001588A86E|nr:uncharacterized protein LOC118073209 [Chelonus insularis]